jgi:cytochrome bd-type quinol oxidase subunit 1
MRTTEGASQLPATVVASSLAIYLALYLFALLAFLVFARRWIQTGPATATGISS